MRLKLISCEVLFREMCAHSPHQVDLEFLPTGLHDLGSKPMAAKLQEVVDRTPEGVYEAILLGYDSAWRARSVTISARRAHVPSECCRRTSRSSRWETVRCAVHARCCSRPPRARRGRGKLRSLSRHVELAADPDFQYLYAEMMALARYRLNG